MLLCFRIWIVMIETENWGMIDYRAAWRAQQELSKSVYSGEKSSTLVLCQHPTVITIGRNGTDNNVLISGSESKEKNIEIIPINRGGDVTLHNPGQLVGYPIFRLSDFKEDLHWFLREIEQCIIELIRNYGISGDRVNGLTGVWIENQRKICAIGIHCSRWVTSHGFALNVQNDIRQFDMIVPCGIREKSVTSMEREVVVPIDFAKIEQQCSRIFSEHFA